MILIAISFHGNKGILRAVVDAPRKYLEPRLFKSKENTLSDINEALQKGQFRSFAVKGRGPDPQDPLVGRMYPYLRLS